MSAPDLRGLHNPFLSDGRFRVELQIDCSTTQPAKELLNRSEVALTFPSQDWIDLVAGCESIKALFIDRPRARNFAPIVSLSLFHVSFSYPSGVKDWSFLSQMSTLRHLALHNTLSIVDLEPVSSLVDLEVFQLSGGYSKSLRIPSLKPLTHCRRLKGILLANIRCEDWGLAPLFEMAELRQFDCPLWWPNEELSALFAHNGSVGSNAGRPSNSLQRSRER